MSIDIECEIARISVDLEEMISTGKAKAVCVIVVNDEGGFRELLAFGDGTRLVMLAALNVVAHNLLHFIADRATELEERRKAP